MVVKLYKPTHAWGGGGTPLSTASLGQELKGAEAHS